MEKKSCFSHFFLMSACMNLNKYDFIALTEDWYSEANNKCQLQYHLAADDAWHSKSWAHVQEVNGKGKLKMDEVTKANRKIQGGDGNDT